MKPPDKTVGAMIAAVGVAVAALVAPMTGTWAPAPPARAALTIEPALPDMGADAGGGHISEREPRTAEDAVSIVADRISDLSSGTGYAGMTTSARTRTIELYWKGEPSADLVAYLNTTPHGVRVTLHTGATWDRATMLAAAQRVAHTDPELVDRLGIVIVSVRHDGSGITVSLKGDTTPPAAQRAEIERLANLPGGVHYAVNQPKPLPQPGVAR